jgi:hypothetical protein
MNKIIKTTCVFLCFAGTLFKVTLAGETSHYVNGVEGIKCATLPPPGKYWLTYNTFYSSNDSIDKDGNKLDINFNIDVYALCNRFVWVTNKKLLNANYTVDIIIPLVYTDIKIGALGINDHKFGLGDICIEPLALSWHGSRYDTAFGLSVFVPIGEYDANKPASPGKDFWTGMITLGGTYYFDTEKAWSASILARYEINSEKSKTDIKPGNDFHFEWGIGKRLAKFWNAGLTGYCRWQVTDDSGAGVTWDKNIHDRVFSVGPEINVFLPSVNYAIVLRHQREFSAKDRSEGNVTTLNLIKKF